MQDIEELIMRIGQMMDEKLDEKLDKKLDEKLDEKFQLMSDRFDKKLSELREEMNAKFLLLEDEHGTKIDAIFDAVILEKDKNIEKSDKIRKLDKRLEKAEANIFCHEKRISNLEMNS